MRTQTRRLKILNTLLAHIAFLNIPLDNYLITLTIKVVRSFDFIRFTKASRFFAAASYSFYGWR